MKRRLTKVPVEPGRMARIGLPAVLRRAVCMATLVLVASGRIPAQATPSEYEVKAAMLYNLTKFVKLPADSKANPSAPS